MAPAQAKGICPNCETRTGPVGEPCGSDVCGRKGYAFIPRPWYDSAKQFASRKQRPLDPLLGRNIDRYLLAGKIGEGGMGAVYVALQRPLNREVALKVISGLEMTQTTIARFEREARAVSVLDHPNIVKLYDYGVGDLEFRVPYMALEYVKHGRTLRRALAQMRQDSGGAAIPGEVVLSIFGQVLHALNAAHGVGIIHRDMKPDNVMLAPVSGNPYFVKVLDFGLAKAVADVSGFDGTVSRTGQFLGTPMYMAPEQAPRKGQPAADHRADLYAVAVMLFEVFTGKMPFEGETVIEVLTKKVDPSHDPCGYPEARALPRQLRAFLARGMDVDPGARFGDAEDMLSAFEGALSGRRATAVGLAGGRPGSSDERPATPESPGPADGAAPKPTTPLGDSAEAASFWRDVAASTAERPRKAPWLRWLVVAGAVLAAAAVVAGIWLAVAKGPAPGPAADAASQAAPSAPQPAVEPARAAEPVPVPVAEPAVAPVPGPVPAVVPAAEPAAASAEAPRAVASPAPAPAPARTVVRTPPRVPEKKPVPRPKPPEPVPAEKPKRL
jgi:serine/threonine-protein kinase